LRLAGRARLALGLALGCAAAVRPAVAGAQQRGPDVRIVERGPGFMGGVLAAALASPHTVVGPADSAARVSRTTRVPNALIVLARDATIEGRVRGDVVVVGGDLYVRPGAVIEGRAVAIGGVVVVSALASVRDGRLSYDDATYDVSPAPGGGWELRYRRLTASESRDDRPRITPGIGMPTYDRVNGLSLGLAPTFSLADDRLALQPSLTYRSDLGVLDPGGRITGRLDDRTRAELWMRRGTFTNDAWIYGDLLNSVNTLFGGRDLRNYFRGTRADLRVYHRTEGERWEIEPWIGGRWERAESVVMDTGTTHAPWSLFGRTSDEGMRRPNPPIDDGRLGAGLLGARLRWEPGDVRAVTDVETEIALDAPGNRRFAQTTVDVRLSFPTFGRQRYRLEAHGVVTGGDSTVRQRYVHLGGSGTLRTLGAFEQAGDQLLFLEHTYSIPFERPALPLIGGPTLALRYVVGSTGVGSLPPLEQEVGVRVVFGLLRADLLRNPGRGVSKGSVGFSFTR